MMKTLEKIEKMEALEAIENSYSDVMEIPEAVLDESYNLFWEIVAEIVNFSNGEIDKMTVGRMLKHHRKELKAILKSAA